MPAQTKKSPLAGKLAASLGKAFNANKDNEIVLGGGAPLPAGIEMGIAQLVDIKIGVYEKGDNKGKPYFFAAGSVHAPAEFEGLPLIGLRTQIGPEPLCDTPKASTKKTLADHAAWVVNELKKLGVATEELDFEQEGVFESVIDALKETKPFFRFRTWKGEKQTEGAYAGKEPRVNHDWRGVIPDYSPEDSDGEVVDNQPEEEPSKPATKPAAKPGAKPGAKKPAPAPEPEEETTEEEEVDLDALAEAADDGDEEATLKLQELGTAAGISEDDMASAENWGEVVGLIRIGESGEAAEEETEEEAEEETEESEEEAWKPAKGETYKTTILDVKTKKKKSVECEIVTVNEEKETVTVKIGGKPHLDLKTKKPAVLKWDALESAE